MKLNLENEVWKMAQGSSYHEVSNMGGVRSLPHVVSCGPAPGVRRVGGVTLNPFISTATGYLQVVFADRKKHSVHRLVAHAFCDGYVSGKVVNHKNGIKTDNRASNLEWVTHAQNNQHAFSVLGRKGSGTGKFGSAHQTSKAVIMTSIADGTEELFGCALDAVRKYPFLDSGSISYCCQGKRKSTKGYRFRFAA